MPNLTRTQAEIFPMFKKVGLDRQPGGPWLGIWKIRWLMCKETFKNEDFTMNLQIITRLKKEKDTERGNMSCVEGFPGNSVDTIIGTQQAYIEKI